MTLAVAVTALVVTDKLTDDCPAATVAEDGTGKAVFELLNATATPPAGAALLSVMETTAAEPPVRLDGLTETEASDGRTTGATVTLVVLLTVRYVAVMVAETDAVTLAAFTLTLATLWPAGIVRLAATGNALFEVESCTTAPPVGAPLDRFTVTVAELPAVTVEGETLTESSAAAGAVYGLYSCARL